MTRKKCEKELIKKIKEIYGTAKEFSKDTKYISIYCIEKNGKISIGLNNEFYKDGYPKQQKLYLYHEERIENDEKYTD